MKLSIIIPAYNEEKRILPTLENFYDFCVDKLRKSFEIVVVVNNCSDNTLQVVDDFCKDKEEVVCCNLSFHSGKGGAIIEGFKLSKGEKVGFVDADGSTDAKNFFELFNNLNGYDGIIASRRLKNSKVINREASKKIESFFFNCITRMLFGLVFKDTQCGAKLFTKECSQLIIKDFSEKGWIFDVDILTICKNKNLKIKEFPIEWEDKKGTKLTWFDKISSIIDLFRYRLK